MAIVTDKALVSRALAFYNTASIYFCIGGNGDGSETDPAKWVDENNPPIPASSLVALTYVSGYRKIDTKQMVVRDDTNGTIVFPDSKWRIVTPAEAYTEGAKSVYLETTIQYDELPLGFYRQLGVFTGLTPAEGVPGGQMALLPAEVEDVGTLEVVEYLVKSERIATKKEKLTTIVQF